MNSPESSVEQTIQPSAPLSAGRMLRAAREAQGVHLAVLSVNLKVSVRQLEALEADQYASFKGLAFVRALAQSVCRQLKIDPAPVLAALPRHATPQALEPVSLASRQAAHAARPAKRSSGANKGLSRQVMLLAVLMLVGAAALIWWPNTQETAVTTEETQEPVQAAVPMEPANEPAQASEVQAPPQQPASSPVPAVPAVTRPVVDAPATKPLIDAPMAAASSIAGELPLVLKLTADAWVEVRDSRGQMALRRIVKAGETVKLDAPAPLFVYVGRADSAELNWQGKPVDLKPYTQNNEARLQIKP